METSTLPFCLQEPAPCQQASQHHPQCPTSRHQCQARCPSTLLWSTALCLCPASALCLESYLHLRWLLGRTPAPRSSRPPPELLHPRRWQRMWLALTGLRQLLWRQLHLNHSVMRESYGLNAVCELGCCFLTRRVKGNGINLSTGWRRLPCERVCVWSCCWA